jgi:hypothetical protein
MDAMNMYVRMYVNMYACVQNIEVMCMLYICTVCLVYFESFPRLQKMRVKFH